MKLQLRATLNREHRPAAWACLAGLCLLIAACDPLPVAMHQPTVPRPATTPTPALPNSTPIAPPAATAVADSSMPHATAGMYLGVVLSVLHVQIPHEHRQQAEPLWNHLREDLFGSAVVLRLRRNGLRVGVGNAQWWDAVKATLDAIDGVRSVELDPVRLPANYPLALELDQQPREQTLFFVGEDGILSGDTWPLARTVLRLSYDLNLQNPDRVRLTIVPEVRQRLEGWRWVQRAGKLTREPRYSGRAFPAASFTAELEPQEFLLLAPGPRADLWGLIGGALLTSDVDGQRFDSYLFLRADLNHVSCGY